MADKNEELQIQLGFHLLKQTSEVSMAISNTIIIKSGEKRALVISELPLWPYNDSKNNPGLIFYSQIDPSQVFVKVTYLTGNKLIDVLLQSFFVLPPCANSFVRQPKVRALIDGQSLQSSDSWFQLKRGSTIQIATSTIVIGNENCYITKFLQKSEELIEGG